MADKKTIHIIGIGGIGTSGLAQIFHSEGKTVTGSDLQKTELTKKLEKSGIKIMYGHKPGNITTDIDTVIYSQAITENNPEYKKAKEYNIPLVSYPQALGSLMKGKKGIAISGTHGKTTTSALIVHLLSFNRLNPNFVIGGEILGMGNSGTGKSDLLVVEACEYKRSFLNYQAEIGIITSIEEDHLDYYKDITDIVSAFKEFSRQIKKGTGTLIANADDEKILNIVSEHRGKMITYGIKNGELRTNNIVLSKEGNRFDCIYKNEPIGTFRTNLCGIHNVLNALACIAVGLIMEISLKNIKKALETFPGVTRRFHEIRNSGGITIIDDYGHHPSEITATLNAVKQKFQGKRLFVVFQPHQYSRTRFFLNDFASCFNTAAEVIVPEIFFVRDSQTEKEKINSSILVERMKQNGAEAKYIPGFDEIAGYLYKKIQPEDVILTIGAGPVNEVAYKLKELIEAPKKNILYNL